MLLSDVLRVLLQPRRGFALELERRSLGVAAALVTSAGVLALGLSVLAILLEPGSADRAAALGISAFLPVLFVGFWLIDSFIVDAVAQVMGAPARLRAWMVMSAHAIPALVLYEPVRVLQALLDRAAHPDVATGVGFADFLVLLWFIALIAVGVRALYGLPGMSALAAAMAPPAAMATLLILLLILFSVLHLAGVG